MSAGCQSRFALTLSSRREQPRRSRGSEKRPLRNWLECERGFGSRPSKPGHLKLPLQAEPFEAFVEACHMDLTYRCKIASQKRWGEKKKNPTWLFRCKVTAMFQGIMVPVPRCALITGTWHLAYGLGGGARVWRLTHPRFGLRESQD